MIVEVALQLPHLTALAPIVAAPVARFLLYVGAVVLMGRTLAAFTTSPAPHGITPAARALTHSGTVALVMAPALLLLSQVTALDMSAADVPALLRDSAWGRGWMALTVATVASAVLLLLISARRVISGALALLLAVCALALAGTMSGLGHAAADLRWPMIARLVDSVHVVAMGGWIGGLLVTWLGTRGGPMAWTVASWRAFSRTATAMAPLAVVTGVGSSAMRLADATWPDATSAIYAQLLAAKVVLVLVVLAYGARMRRIVHRASMPPSRALAQEAGLAFVVLVLTAVLTGAEPPMAP